MWFKSGQHITGTSFCWNHNLTLLAKCFRSLSCMNCHLSGISSLANGSILFCRISMQSAAQMFPWIQTIWLKLNVKKKPQSIIELPPRLTVFFVYFGLNYVIYKRINLCFIWPQYIIPVFTTKILSGKFHPFLYIFFTSPINQTSCSLFVIVRLVTGAHNSFLRLFDDIKGLFLESRTKCWSKLADVLRFLPLVFRLFFEWISLKTLVFYLCKFSYW